jgi:NADH:ubiquinone oxidoreductase subunit 4 (subunit M)
MTNIMLYVFLYIVGLLFLGPMSIIMIKDIFYGDCDRGKAPLIPLISAFIFYPIIAMVVLIFGIYMIGDCVINNIRNRPLLYCKRGNK